MRRHARAVAESGGVAKQERGGAGGGRGGVGDRRRRRAHARRQVGALLVAYRPCARRVERARRARARPAGSCGGAGADGRGCRSRALSVWARARCGRTSQVPSRRPLQSKQQQHFGKATRENSPRRSRAPCRAAATASARGSSARRTSRRRTRTRRRPRASASGPGAKARPIPLRRPPACAAARARQRQTCARGRRTTPWRRGRHGTPASLLLLLLLLGAQAAEQDEQMRATRGVLVDEARRGGCERSLERDRIGGSKKSPVLVMTRGWALGCDARLRCKGWRRERRRADVVPVEWPSTPPLAGKKKSAGAAAAAASRAADQRRPRGLFSRGLNTLTPTRKRKQAAPTIARDPSAEEWLGALQGSGDEGEKDRRGGRGGWVGGGAGGEQEEGGGKADGEKTGAGERGGGGGERGPIRRAR